MKDHPGLIIVRVSGYGQTGPYSDRAGFGGIGEAMGGWRYIVGDPDRAPSRMGISIGDSLAATYGCLGALAALRHRDQTGQGQVVDSSLYEAVLQVMESMVPDYSVTGYIRERSGSFLPGIAPSNVYKCSDGEYLIGANQDTVFCRLCDAMGRPGGDATPWVFSGTLVVKGRAAAIVQRTGAATELGRIGTALRSIEPGHTALEREIDRLVRVVAALGLASSGRLMSDHSLTGQAETASRAQADRARARACPVASSLKGSTACKLT
jgi:crotonobetainyl-CoA:carnitine CoA-transferase CaiB-like acyl-CoA transferase